MMLGWMVIQVASAAPLVEVVGSCPGPVEFQVTGAVPSGSLLLLSSASDGGSAVPSGYCAGTPLSGARPAIRGRLPADGRGEASLPVTLPAAACGAVVEVVDIVACESSPGQRLLEACPARPEAEVRSSGPAPGVFDPDLVVVAPTGWWEGLRFQAYQLADPEPAALTLTYYSGVGELLCEARVDLAGARPVHPTRLTYLDALGGSVIPAASITQAWEVPVVGGETTCPTLSTGVDPRAVLGPVIYLAVGPIQPDYAAFAEDVYTDAGLDWSAVADQASQFYLGSDLTGGAYNLGLVFGSAGSCGVVEVAADGSLVPAPALRPGRVPAPFLLSSVTIFPFAL